jgi:CheY-like chemotaxis protein
MATERERKRGRLDVLLVEDNQDIREVVAQLLEYSGCRVCAAADGEEALAELASSYRPEVILLSLENPRMDGWGFRAEQLRRAELREIPIILISGLEDLEAIGRSLGAAATHRKPIVIPELLEILEAFRRGPDASG